MASTKTKAATKTGSLTKHHDPNDLRSLILGCFEDIEKNKFSLNQYIYEVYESEIYKSWGFEDFKSYVDQELPVEYRVAMWYRQMGKVMNLFGITQQQVDEIGWTSFKELATLITDKTDKSKVVSFLAYAKAHSFREVAEYVRKEKAKVHGKVAEERFSISLTFNKDQHAVYQEVLSESKALADTENDALAIEYALSEWLANHKEGGNAAVKAGLHPTKEPEKLPQTVERAGKGKKKGAKKAAKKEAKKKATKKEAKGGKKK